jgi:hypothetical protein
MDERQVEESLLRLKSKLQVNEQLKRQLRASILGRRRRRLMRRSAFVSAIAAVALLLVFVFQFPAVQKVEAASLKIHNQISFVDVGSGSPLGVSEHEGSVYIPVFGKGLFMYDNLGFHRLMEQEVNAVQVAASGKRLLLSSGGTVGIYDLEKKAYSEVLRGDGSTLFYEEPSWKDDHTILYVKRVIKPRETHGFEVVESSILELDLGTGKSVKLADGSYPAYVSGTRSLVFQSEKDSKPVIVRKDLKNKEETIVDEGRFPAVSRYGEYIAYVKTEVNRRELAPKRFVQESVDQLWISDTDGKSKRAVTRNIPNKYIDEQEWLKQTEASDIDQVLEFTGLYSYYNPAWSSETDSLYVLKGENTEGSRLRIMRIDFSKQTLEAVETVKAFNQAVIRRDLDFARSLLRHDQDFIIVSNPHQVSYTILDTGKEGDREYVDVEENWSYTANPNYSIERVRYYVSKSPDGYLIDEMKKLGSTSVNETPDGAIELRKDGDGDGTAKQVLFTRDDIPSELLPKGDYRFASLAYMESRNKLIFTVQALQDPENNRKASVIVASYDVAKQTFERLEQIDTLNDMVNVGVSSIIVSPSGDDAALDLFSDDDRTFASHLLVLDLKNKQQVWVEQLMSDTRIESAHAYYWDGDTLYFTLVSSEQTMHYRWDAVNRQIGRP